MPVQSPDGDRDRQAGIVAWFVSLIHSHFRHQHREAAEALEVLEREGVSVKFRRPKRRADKGVADGQ